MVSIYRWLMFLRDFMFRLVGFDARRSFRGVALRLFEMGGHVFHAHIFKSLASRHQAIVEADVGVSAVQLAHLESLRALAGDVQTFAFPFGVRKTWSSTAPLMVWANDASKETTALPSASCV